MRFVIGVALGFAVGLAGAILFAPNQSRERESAPATEGEASSRDVSATIKETARQLRVNAQEAMRQARQAAREAEDEMRHRYRQRMAETRRKR